MGLLRALPCSVLSFPLCSRLIMMQACTACAGGLTLPNEPSPIISSIWNSLYSSWKGAERSSRPVRRGVAAVRGGGAWEDTQERKGSPATIDALYISGLQQTENSS